ncbi:MAG TPA: glycosyltransferase family 2 protein [Acidimicrobiales bacterium]|nr:glycosyltransferase family 2 protein [Acidimicrobiales bacterium]
METLAPPVVAVVVAHDPGPWFEETLASLAAQDYAELAVLVLDSGSTEDLTVRVAAVLPTAFVRRFEENRGFGSTVNEVRSMVDGADYFLLCHDDVALFPDTVHLMVEEAFRSNAGIVSPKVVSWDDPDRLVHVGMAADKGGSVVERVQPYEIDHGQHDAVRDVFVVPGGVTLIRADLFEELEGFDPTIVAMGEDLDLCWRAQVVGARIIVAPDARVRHLQELAAGMRPIDQSLVQPGLDGPPTHPVTLQELQRRHELLAVFKCYGLFHLIRVVPQVLVLAVGEVIVAEIAGDNARARAVRRAWRWNVSRLSTTRAQRKGLKAHRRLGDKEIRLLQIGGSARLSAYFRRVFQHGFHGAHADELAADEGPDVGGPGIAAAPVGVGAFDRGVDPASTEPHRGRLGGRVRLTVWLGAAVVVLIGSRGVITRRLPAVGQFVPFPSWSATLSQFAAGWHPSGVGTTAPASPALGLVALVGTLLAGGMGLTQKVLVFACVPLGAWGMVRLLRPFGSQRASMVGGLAYLAMALPYNALALGRFGALVVYAGGPWVMARLVRATRIAPYGLTGGSSGTALPSDAAGLGQPARRRTRFSTWVIGHPGTRNAVALGLLEAVLISFVPSAAIAVVLIALALLLSSSLFGDWPSTWRAVRLALGATLVAACICLPWVIGALSAGWGAVNVFGVPTPASGAASWGSLLRFAVGPIGASPLAWGFALAAVVPLVLARGERFRWAGRFWSVALVFWATAWVVGRGWTGSLAIDPLVLLGPAAVAIASAIGLGVAAFEEDLRAAAFGWRQLVTVVATGAVVLGAVPTLISSLPGRWDLPTNDFSQSVAWMHAKSASGSFRVVWLGDARSLNQGSWSAGDGLAYATSEDGGPDARWLWNAAGPGPTADVASAVNLARAGRTDQIGRLLAPAGVRFVAVLTSLAPEIDGEQNPEVYPVPADLAPALMHQLDLSSVLSGTGITVYANADWIPQRSEVPRGTSLTGMTSTPRPLAGAAGTGIVPGAVPVLPGPVASRSYSGPLAMGTVLASLAPAGRWGLTGPTGAGSTRSPLFGWAARYTVTGPGVATLGFDDGWVTPVSLLLSVIVWLAAIAVLGGRQLGAPWPRLRIGRGRTGAAGQADDGPDPGSGTVLTSVDRPGQP